MAKEIVAKVKLQCPAGQATPAPPVGPALGQHGVPIKLFVDRFNAATESQKGVILPIEITVYKDKSFDFIVKQPPATALLKMAAGLKMTGKPGTGSGTPHVTKVGKITTAQLREIAERKLPDMNSASIEAAMKVIAGSARSMGIDIAD